MGVLPLCVTGFLGIPPCSRRSLPESRVSQPDSHRLRFAILKLVRRFCGVQKWVSLDAHGYHPMLNRQASAQSSSNPKEYHRKVNESSCSPPPRNLSFQPNFTTSSAMHSAQSGVELGVFSFRDCPHRGRFRGSSGLTRQAAVVRAAYRFWNNQEL